MLKRHRASSCFPIFFVLSLEALVCFLGAVLLWDLTQRKERKKETKCRRKIDTSQNPTRQLTVGLRTYAIEVLLKLELSVQSRSSKCTLSLLKKSDTCDCR